MSIEYFVAALILACISAYLFYRNASKIRQAAYDTEFRRAFAFAVSELESPVRTQDVRDILISEFHAHNVAVITFRGNINWFRRYRLKKAWQQYHSGHNFDAEAWSIPKEERLFLDCFSIEDQSKGAKIYIDRIHKILSIANQK